MGVKMTEASNLDETHDPARRSFVDSANRDDTDFPIQNLPLGVFSTRSEPTPRIGVAIGDSVFDLKKASQANERLAASISDALQETSLNSLFALGVAVVRDVRRSAADMLDSGSSGNQVRAQAADLLTPMTQCNFHLPTKVANYTDFYAGIYHAQAAGALLTPENPLPANYKWIPIAYHGRASSVQIGRGTGACSIRPIRWPAGWTFISKWLCRPRRRAARMSPPSRFSRRTQNISTGRQRRWSRITRSTAAIFSQAT
jgi:fumarylacetoacetase